MKKFFKKLKDKLGSKRKENKINSELSDAYDPEDFDEETGEYELSKVNFDESTGQYDLETLEQDQADSESEEESSGETLAELLKKARETDSEEVLADEEDDFEEEAFEAETLDVSTLKEKYQAEAREESEEESEEGPQAETPQESNDELPDFPNNFAREDATDENIQIEDHFETEEEFAFEEPDLPEQPELPDGEFEVADEELPPADFMPEPPDSELADTESADSESPESEPIESDHEEPHYPENIQDIPAEFNQDVREHLTAETELPSPEPTFTASGFKGIVEKLKKPETYKEMLKHTESKMVSMNLTDQFSRIFSREKRPAVHRAFIWTMTLSISAILGQIIGNFFVVDHKEASPSVAAVRLPPDNLSKDLRVFYANDLFKPAEHEKDQKAVVVDKPKEPKKAIDFKTKCTMSAGQRSSAPVTLMNTVVLQDSVKSIASVSIRGGKGDIIFREGDEIKSEGVDAKSRIDHIDTQKLIIKNMVSGECEYIAVKGSKEKPGKKIKPYKVLSPSQGKKLLENKDMDDSVQNEGNKYAIKKEERTKLLANLDELLTQALAVQIKNPDGSLSFKLTEIVPGSFYTKIGIQNGDIIKSINGKPITNMNQVMTLFGKISEVDQFQLGILRSGSTINKEYNFE